MLQFRKIYYFIFLFIFLTGGYFLVLFLNGQFSPSQEFIGEENSSPLSTSSQSFTKNKEVPIQNPLPKNETSKSIVISQKIQQVVPFITQAPFADWKNKDFQNGCEEASVVMTMGWLKNEKTISQEEAKKRILEIIAFENKTLGYSADTDTKDIVRIFQQFFQHQNVRSQENITINDIKAELQKGNLVLVPAFGRALQNPNFTQPGPITHMLVIIGYDPVTKEFITNDPGTRNGAGYRYTENLLFSATWGYPSGKEHPPIPADGKMTKALISIGK